LDVLYSLRLCQRSLALTLLSRKGCLPYYAENYLQAQQVAHKQTLVEKIQSNFSARLRAGVMITTSVENAPASLQRLKLIFLR
jgi:uncharacterized NAD(P)/FAD-binding protein YdhS